jgi:hypothetical protein
MELATGFEPMSNEVEALDVPGRADPELFSQIQIPVGSSSEIHTVRLPEQPGKRTGRTRDEIVGYERRLTKSQKIAYMMIVGQNRIYRSDV